MLNTHFTQKSTRAHTHAKTRSDTLTNVRTDTRTRLADAIHTYTHKSAHTHTHSPFFSACVRRLRLVCQTQGKFTQKHTHTSTLARAQKHTHAFVCVAHILIH
eukprot:GDKI01026586.1.p1 GENE.GDKI01026586.1~~GDKI01026586.1.p1  ORF type:complete len:103 (+),score=32.68 GDKI01026586.1:110-418(+)